MAGFLISRIGAHLAHATLQFYICNILVCATLHTVKQYYIHCFYNFSIFINKIFIKFVSSHENERHVYDLPQWSKINAPKLDEFFTPQRDYWLVSAEKPPQSHRSLPVRKLSIIILNETKESFWCVGYWCFRGSG